MKKVLIFYSKTGGGHLRAAEAIAEQLKIISPDTKITLVDGLEKNDFRVPLRPQTAFQVLSNQLLWYFNLNYILTNNFAGMIYFNNLIRLVFGTNIRNIIKRESPDLIISTHHFISPSTIGRYPKNIPFVVVVTDLGIPHHLWFDKKASLTITPSQRTAAHAKRVIGEKNSDKVIILDYPLKGGFKTLSHKPHPTNTILVLGGGAGSAKIKKQVLELLNALPDKKIIAVCGYNEQLKTVLEKLNNPKLKVFSFVHNMHELISESDIVLTKAGPATIIESAILKKPLIITDWVGMQERDNVEYVLQEKLGIYCPDIKKLPESVDKLYKDYDSYTKHNITYSDGALKIAQKIATLL